MPSLPHETFVRLFRERPELAPELLAGSLGIVLPAYSELRTESAELTEVTPTEYRADLVVLLVDGAPVLGIVVEVQLSPDAEKRFSWPVYIATLRARLRCDVCLLVVTPSATVAKWARHSIDLGPGGRFQPLVIGPDAIPIVDDPDVARRAPEMAVLSVMAHGNDVDAERAMQMGLAAVAAWHHLDTDQASFYIDVVFAALGDAARSALEALMESSRYPEFQSGIARKWAAAGRAEGEAAGRAEGEAAGRVEGEARMLFAVLDERQLEITAEHRTRILACRDVVELERWTRRAVTVKATEELFE